MTQHIDKFDLEDRLVSFSVSITDIAESLPDTRLGSHIAGQLLRAGTSPASNYGEAQGAESRRDFIHKMKISLKELREVYVWLKIVRRKNLINGIEIEKLINENNELISIFVASIATAQRNMRALGISNNEQGIKK